MLELTLTKTQMLCEIRAMTDAQLQSESSKLRHAQRAAQRRADWVERELRKRDKAAK
jgi:hypothetical protein